jgi:hypothetical protein
MLMARSPVRALLVLVIRMLLDQFAP